MSRGRTLTNLVVDLRLETGRSSTVTANADELAELEYLLRTKQEFYYDDYDWPHLTVYRRLTPVINQRYYDFPSDLNVEATTEMFIKDGNTYVPLDRGIDIKHYNAHDSLQARAATGTVTVTGGTASAGVNKVTAITVNSVDVLVTDVDWVTSHTATATAIAAQINSTTSTPNYTATSSGAVVTISAAVTVGDGANGFVVTTTEAGDVTTTDVNMASGVDAETDDPPRRWEIREDDEDDSAAIELWPVPASADAELWLLGKRSLGALATGTDTCLLDSQLLVLTAAAELLMRAKKPDASAKAQAAARRYNHLKARSKPDAAPFILGGGVPRESPGTTIRISG